MSSTRLEQLATWLSTTGASIVDALPVPNARSRITFALSCAFLCALYVFAVRVRGYDAPFPPQKDALKLDGEAVRQWRKQQAKLRSWILTGFSALVMTLGSLPYLVDLVLAKGDVARVARRESLSQALSTFFVAYLCCDLAIGSLQYRKQITLLTGWIHHSAYTMLLVHVIDLNICHIFAMAAVMELPTMVLAAAVLFPETRNDIVFASLFFVTRIVLHAVLMTLYGSSYGRNYGTSLFDASGSPVGSWVPLLALCAAAPLHITWFNASVRGILKRRRAAKHAAVAITLGASGEAKPEVTAMRPRLVSMASSYLASPRSTVLTFRPTTRMADRARRQRIARAIEQEVQDFFKRPRLVWRRSAGEYDPLDHDVLKGIGSSRSLTRLRLQTGRQAEQAKRIGGQVRRGLVGF